MLVIIDLIVLLLIVLRIFCFLTCGFVFVSMVLWVYLLRGLRLILLVSVFSFFVCLIYVGDCFSLDCCVVFRFGWMLWFGCFVLWVEIVLYGLVFVYICTCLVLCLIVCC